jgi:hypothetical protein|tara:strand:+ start:255 stop:497 length:243 start_codon:yes stop_codon:yes gene_type:complete
MSNEVIGSAFHEEKNMKFIEKESDFVWQDSKTGKFGKGKNCPFQSGVLIAGMGDPVPNVKIAPKKAPAPKTKAVKPSENK